MFATKKVGDIVTSSVGKKYRVVDVSFDNINMAVYGCVDVATSLSNGYIGHTFLWNSEYFGPLCRDKLNACYTAMSVARNRSAECLKSSQKTR